MSISTITLYFYEAKAFVGFVTITNTRCILYTINFNSLVNLSFHLHATETFQDNGLFICSSADENKSR